MDITNSSQENEKQENHHHHRFCSCNNVFTFTSTRLSINGLTNKRGIVTLFHWKNMDSLPLTKGLVGGCVCGTLWLYTTFFRGISH